MKIGNLLFVILAVLVPLVVLIRWKKTRKRPNHPLLINQWTGALEVVEKEEQSKGATEERHGETEQSHSGMVPINGNQEDVENTAAASASEAELKIIDHCEAFFRVHPHTYQADDDATKIAVFPPTKARGWWTYVTLGLHRETGVELVMYSYLEEKQIVPKLTYVAERIREKWAEERKTPLPGNTFALGEPLVDGSSLDYVLATAPYFEKEGFEYYTNGEKTVRVLMLHPIAASEVRYLYQYGWDALVESFVKNEVNSLDFYRIPLEEGVYIDESDSVESDRSGGVSRAYSVDSGKERH